MMWQPPKSVVLWAGVRLLVWLTLSGCAGNTVALQSAHANARSATQVYEQSNPATQQMQFVWEAPTTNMDGTPLTDLAGYKLHYGQGSRTYTHTVDLGWRTTYAPTKWKSGRTYYVALTAYDTSGNESNFTPELRVTVPNGLSPAPTLTITPLLHGQETHFEVAGAHAGDLVFFFFSLTGQGDGPCARELGGVCVDLYNPEAFGKIRADDTGMATLTLPIPAKAPIGQEIFVQAVIRRGAEKSRFIKTNVIARVVQ